MMKAIEAGIEVVDQHDGKFSDDNAEKNVGLRLTLANLLVSVRRAPGDFALSARLNRESLTMLPPSMDNQRYRINSDLSVTLSGLAQEGGALEPGAEVTVSGLKARPELNGVAGKIVVWYPDRGRYAVKVGDAEEVALKPINLGQTPEMFDEAYLARVREATDIAKALDPDAGGLEGDWRAQYPNELRELKTEALSVHRTRRLHEGAHEQRRRKHHRGDGGGEIRQGTRRRAVLWSEDRDMRGVGRRRV